MDKAFTTTYSVIWVRGFSSDEQVRSSFRSTQIRYLGPSGIFFPSETLSLLLCSSCLHRLLLSTEDFESEVYLTILNQDCQTFFLVCLFGSIDSCFCFPFGSFSKFLFNHRKILHLFISPRDFFFFLC